jgi:hypothetical protein
VDEVMGVVVIGDGAPGVVVVGVVVYTAYRYSRSILRGKQP